MEVPLKLMEDRKYPSPCCLNPCSNGGAISSQDMES